MNKGLNAVGVTRGHNTADIATTVIIPMITVAKYRWWGGAFSASVQEMQVGSIETQWELSGGDIELITSGSVQPRDQGVLA